MNPVILTLDAKGRCCGKRPLVYKRQHKMCCIRCGADFTLEGQQQSNYAWKGVDGGFVPVQMNNNANARAFERYRQHIASQVAS